MTKGQGIPGIARPSLLKQRSPREIAASGPPLITAGIAVYATWGTPIAWVSLAGLTWLLGASIWKVLAARAEDADAAPERNHEWLTPALMMLHAMAAHMCGIPKQEADGRLRATFHRVVEPIDDPAYIEQLVNYVGGSADGCGRRFSVRSGITGMAIRNADVYKASFGGDDEGERRRELVQVWGYTDVDARRLRPGRNSLIAVPILSSPERGHKVIGVVYLDSDKRNLFDAPDIVEAITRSCGAIAQYVTRRYDQ